MRRSSDIKNAPFSKPLFNLTRFLLFLWHGSKCSLLYTDISWKPFKRSLASYKDSWTEVNRTNLTIDAMNLSTPEVND